MKTIGMRVHARRKQLGLSQMDLAERVGIKQPTLSQIERDQTKEMEASTLAGLCRELMLTPDYIITGSGPITDNDQAVKEAELLFVLRSLEDDKKETLLDMARALYSRPKPIQVPVNVFDTQIGGDLKKH